MSMEEVEFGHIGLFPSAGMGHLTPFLRLAALLLNHNLRVTLIVPIPTVSLSESQALLSFSASFPQLHQQHLHLLPLDPNSNPTDPFFDQMGRIFASAHLLSPLISSLSPPLSALVADMTLVTSVIPITQSLRIPLYTLFTSSAKMLSLFVSLPSILGSLTPSELDQMDPIKFPSLDPIPRSMIPPPLLQSTENIFKTLVAKNGEKLGESSGILVNTFESIENELLSKLNSGSIKEKLAPVTAIGPLPPSSLIKNNEKLSWLASKPAGSVVYVSFGSRTAVSREQMRQLGEGLVKSGHPFLWVVKDKKVDAEDEQGLEEILGSGLVEKLENNGMVIKNWVDQGEVLGHESVGCFVSHCGWNSATEAMWNGVRVLAWPQHGDQKINAEIVDRVGLGIWDKSWGWGKETVVNADEIAEKIKYLMGNEALREKALHIRGKARKAVANGGTTHKAITQLITTWKKVSSAVV